ncbi:MAG: mannitol dehydrogenase family protein [Phenylobacterium sp.]|uniref:mannitol dehydrogenase family protein n=1 Tax=Phenylobacterium sp. TaxID=1871053 RepID=UPI002734E2EC|nr:mannitol dehydrogenase family protein [Phenylobacterium sp.]MDP3750169.1 mannitol dehydrogenase family protein [Phenylobacterium sp.]
MSPPRLTPARLDLVRPGIALPAYDRQAARIGVVHFGPGAFHRAHQAWYFDEMLAKRPGVAVSAVSLKSPGVREALGPQDGLYVLAEREAQPTFRVIGSIREVLTATQAPDAVFARLASPEVWLVTATVTEKGYCLTPGGDLDETHPDIAHDLERPDTPASFIGWLVEGLARRRAAGLPAFTVLPCDNLSDNGGRLRRAVLQFTNARGDADLAAWIAGEVAFRSTMVDSITPATDDALRTEVAQAVGLIDAWPVQREGFVQWVIEAGSAADVLGEAGATIAPDVAAFERAKLRLLNGAHSTLAYAGLLQGFETVSEAMANPELAAFVEAMMRQDIAPTLDLEAGDYIAEVLRRFRNPAIVHKLSQIAWDGSQKLPFRILETTTEALAAGRPVDRLAVPIAAWMRFVERRTREGMAMVDPLAGKLSNRRGVDAFLELGEVFPRALAGNAAWRTAVQIAYDALPA